MNYSITEQVLYFCAATPVLNLLSEKEVIELERLWSLYDHFGSLYDSQMRYIVNIYNNHNGPCLTEKAKLLTTEGVSK